MKKILTLLTVCLLTAGCLLKTDKHTLYLETDGTVTWTLLEVDVRSDERKEVHRWEQEAAFLERVEEGRHSPMVVFEHLGGFDVESRFLRRQRPYSLFTEGRFRSIDSLIRSVFDEVGLPAEVALDTWTGWSRLTVAVDVWALEEMDENGEFDDETPFREAFWDLLREVDEFEILLAEGLFVDALHFSIEDGGTRAVPELEIDEEQIEAADGVLDFCLLWTEYSDPDERPASPLAACS